MLLLNDSLDAPLHLTVGCGQIVLFTCPAEIDAVNQDSLAIFDVSSDTCVLAVADGVGGGPRGADASRIAIEALAGHLRRAPDGAGLRTLILDAFEAAHAGILDLAAGAATTLAVAEISDGSLRTYHTGDSGALLTGRGGKLKLKTVFHSPSGYAEESGLLSEADALLHDERHYVSNLIGMQQMSVEVGSPVPMARFDTLVVGSDGLFDNLSIAEVVEVVRRGPLLDTGTRLLSRTGTRMRSENLTVPSKPDDLAFALFRLNSNRG